MFVYPLFRPSHCPFPGYTTVTHVVCVYTIPLMGENHINIDVSKGDKTKCDKLSYSA